MTTAPAPTTGPIEGWSAHPADWRGHFVVCGWHEDVGAIVRQLMTMSDGAVPIALVNEMAEETVRSQVDEWQTSLVQTRGDAHRALPPIVHVAGAPVDDAALTVAGTSRARAVLVVVDEAGGPPSDDRTLMQVLAARSKGSDAILVVEVLRSEFAQHVRNAGANEVVVRDAHLPFYLVAASRSPGLGPAVRRLFGSEGAQVTRKEPLPDALRGQTLAEARHFFRRERGQVVVGIVTDPEQVAVEAVLSTGSGWVTQFIQRMLAEAGQDVLAEARGGRRVQINPPDEYVIGPRDSAIVVPVGSRGRGL